VTSKFSFPRLLKDGRTENKVILFSNLSSRASQDGRSFEKKKDATNTKHHDGFQAAQDREEPTHQTCNVGSFVLEGAEQNCEKQWRNLCGGKLTTIHHGPRAEPFKEEDSWQLTRCQESFH
jgi:hypothetical protein